MLLLVLGRKRNAVLRILIAQNWLARYASKTNLPLPPANSMFRFKTYLQKDEPVFFLGAQGFFSVRTHTYVDACFVLLANSSADPSGV